MRNLLFNKRGFTLLELLIAVVIFTIVGVMAMGGFHQLVRQREMASVTMERVRAIQRSVMRMSQDFEQLTARPIRDATSSGDMPALYLNNNGTDVIEFSRAGWSNPTGINRSTLQRVRYRLLDNKLYRDYWTAMDRSLNNIPVQVQLLDKVTSVNLRYMDENKQWQTSWPPSNNGNVSNNQQSGVAPRSLPIAVEFTLTLQDWGEIRRVIEVPNL